VAQVVHLACVVVAGQELCAAPSGRFAADAFITLDRQMRSPWVAPVIWVARVLGGPGRRSDRPVRDRPFLAWGSDLAAEGIAVRSVQAA
jgi:hypothetical protein